MEFTFTDVYSPVQTKRAGAFLVSTYILCLLLRDHDITTDIKKHNKESFKLTRAKF